MLILDVEDNEKMDIHQPEQQIQIKAEAFQISVKFQDLDDENRLDFGTVRVNDIEQ